MSETPTSNAPDLSVSELAASLKRTIETNYDYVRVRGELGRVLVARSGHMYADLKDERAVLNTVMWKGQVASLPFKPEEGLEVIAEGKLSIYAGRSNYQLIASTMRPAGAGALMALLEARRKALAAEGLFDAAHKKPLPTLPSIVGVVTSPTGAVIRDILQRIADRFPVRLILWPTLVQGDSAAAQIEAGIRGFNAMTGPDRPDVLIVGRGGGSIEDLWPFNEEAVVRAAFESRIPLISAVGHETDTTLIDFVADVRAPTPTGAAEMAVPVRADLALSVQQLEHRLARGLKRRLDDNGARLKAARLPRPESLLETKRQRLDFASASLPRSVMTRVERARARLDHAAARLPSPLNLVRDRAQRLANATAGLAAALRGAAHARRLALTRVSARLRPESARTDLRARHRDLDRLHARLTPAMQRTLTRRRDALEGQGKLLETLSHRATLARGFALIRRTDGQLVRSAAAAEAAGQVRLTFSDGETLATTGTSSPPDGTETSRGTRSGTSRTDSAKRKTAPARQRDLF